MDPPTLPELIGRRFHRPVAPSVLAGRAARRPVVFSHVASDAAMPAPTLPPPVEDAYAVHVHHTGLSRGDMWLEGRHLRLPKVEPGGVFIFDLRTRPVAQLHESFEFSRFQLSRATLEELSYEQGARRVGELRAPHGATDKVVQHLADAMLACQQRLGQVDTLFADGIALAFFAHVIKAYGGAVPAAVPRGALAPWQLRRIEDWAQAHLDGDTSLAELAALVSLSPSHFSRSFAKATGVPPHRWLMQRRIARAKQLLLAADLPLSAIAAACGFVDQSHLTRVFARLEGTTPARWLRRVGANESRILQAGHASE